MALKLNERYPGRFSNPTAAYPQGSFKNRTTPDAKDGSYLEKDWANDKEGFFQSLLNAAGFVANGAVDSVGASQYYSALTAIIGTLAPAPPDASTTEKGVVELATNTEAQAGVDSVRAVTPASLASVTATVARAGLVELATDAETQAGTDAQRAVTPASLSARTGTESRSGVLQLATQAEAMAGTESTKALTSVRVRQAISTFALGGGQNYTDLSATRLANTTYTNSSGKPILVVISRGNSAGSGANSHALLVNGVTVSAQSSSVTANPGFVTAIVPDGQTYRLNLAGIASLSSWSELS